MLASLRRIYFYVIATGALLFTTGVLTYFLYDLFRLVGIGSQFSQTFDTIYFNQAFSFLIVDIVIVLPVLLLHRYFIMRDAKIDATALTGVVRMFFIELLTFTAALVTIFTWVSLVDSISYSNLGYQSTTVPTFLAFAIAWSFTLVLLYRERTISGPLQKVSYGFAMLLGYLAQFIVLVNLLGRGGQLVQSIVQRVAGQPHCAVITGTDFKNYYPVTGSIDCSIDSTQSISGQLVSTAILIIGLAILFLWTRGDGNTTYRRIGDVVLIWSAIAPLIIGIQQGIELLLLAVSGDARIIFPESLYNIYYSYNNMYLFLPFLGSLLAGGSALTFMLVRIWRLKVDNRPAAVQPRQLAVVAVAIPLAITFIVGLSQLLANVFIVSLHNFFTHYNSFLISGRNISSSDFLITVSIVLAGAGWIALWPQLARMSDIGGNGPGISRRLYELTVLAGTVLAATIAVAVGLYIVISGLTGSSPDSTNEVAATAFAIAIVNGVIAAYYARIVIRDQRLLQQSRLNAVDGLQPAEVTATPPNTVQSILEQVASGTMSIADATAQLSELYHIE